MRVSYGQVMVNMTLTRMAIYLDTAPGVGKKRVFTLYLNDLPTKMTLTISGLNKTGRVNANISCVNGDICYLREDAVNSPAASNINIGLATMTNDPRRQPIICSPLLVIQGTKLGLFAWTGYDTASYTPYANTETAFGEHSLIAAGGIFRNMQTRGYQLAGMDVTTNIVITQINKLLKVLGADRFYETGLATTVQGLNIRAEDVSNSARAEDGDMFILGASSPNGFGSDYITGVSMDFIPDNPKEGIFGSHAWQSDVSPSPSVDVYGAISGRASFAALATRAERFTLFATPGRLTTMTIWMKSGTIHAGSPFIFVLRKNEVDTAFEFTLSSTSRKQTLNLNLSVNQYDRISLKLKQSVLGGAGENLLISWVFKPTNGGEWPLFGGITTV